MASGPILQLKGISKSFRVGPRTLGRPRAQLRALADIDLEVEAGKTLGIVGESGCGKSTLARIILGLTNPDAGTIAYEGTDLTGLRRRPLAVALGLQMVFQDPYSALNPRMSIGDTVLEPLRVHKVVPRHEAPEERDRLLDIVGLSPSLAPRYPHELSGGQRQRVNIARALSVRPKLIVADEAVSSLDVSVQGQILNLFSDLRDRLGLTLIFVSHDLNVVDHLCDRVAVMYLGRVVEEGRPSILSQGARHPYTRGLASAIPQPVPGPRRTQPAIRGELPSPTSPPSGCHFRTRCPMAQRLCAEIAPPLGPVAPGHLVACHFPLTPPASQPELLAAKTPSMIRP
ncbi:MAG: ATP-binding cassette domain-containing protein [Proteobacteria bacterium]|nr:ATP-binding cassette domain-containing protein [Pseudomonadota bacterium]